MNKFTLDLKNPKLRNPVIVVLIGIGTLALWFYQFYTPISDEISILDRKLKSKQDTLTTILALKPQLDILRLEISAAQVKLDSLKSMFPDQKEIPRLIREITSVARASGITTTKFNPLQDIEREYYVENKYNIAISGGYHQMGDFFSFLANFPLIINLGAVNIAFSQDFTNERKLSEELGIPASSIVASFEMTTFSSKR